MKRVISLMIAILLIAASATSYAMVTSKNLQQKATSWQLTQKGMQVTVKSVQQAQVLVPFQFQMQVMVDVNATEVKFYDSGQAEEQLQKKWTDATNSTAAGVNNDKMMQWMNVTGSMLKKTWTTQTNANEVNTVTAGVNNDKMMQWVCNLNRQKMESWTKLQIKTNTSEATQATQAKAITAKEATQVKVADNNMMQVSLNGQEAKDWTVKNWTTTNTTVAIMMTANNDKMQKNWTDALTSSMTAGNYPRSNDITGTMITGLNTNTTAITAAVNTGVTSNTLTMSVYGNNTNNG